MINELKNIVYTIHNKESRGELSPVQFNNLLWKAVLSKFNNYLVEYRTSVVKANRGFASYGLANQPQQIRQMIDVFGSTKTINALTESPSNVGLFEMPDDCAWVEKIMYGGKEVEEIERSKWINLISSSKAKPDNNFPCYIRVDNQIQVYPKWFSVSVFYIRFPKVPKWTFMEVPGGEPIFNPGAPDYQDIELHQSELPGLVNDICLDLGISLKDGEIAQFMGAEIDKNFQKENIL